MTEEITKVDDYSIQVEKTTTATATSIISYDSLLAQRDSLVAAKAASSAIYDGQIAEVDAYLAAADNLGVVSYLASIAATVGGTFRAIGKAGKKLGIW